MSAGRTRRTLLALGALACAAAAWLFLPRHPRGAPSLVVALVDLSASSARGRPDLARWARERLLEEARLARASGARVALVLFAREVELALAPADPSALERWCEREADRRLRPAPGSSGLASALAPALELALELAPGSRGRAGAEAGEAAGLVLARLALLGDGRASGADPAALLARIGAAGARLVQHAPPPPARADVALEALALPARVAEREPLACELVVTLSSDGALPARARVELELEQADGVRTLVVPLAPEEARSTPDGGARLTLALDLGRAPRGLVRVRARVVGEPPDAWPEDDGALALVRVGDPLAAGLLAPRAEREALAAALAGLDGLALLPVDFEARSGGGDERAADAQLAAALAELDLLVVAGFAPRDVPRAPLEAFLERGGGLCWLADERYLAGWERAEGAAPAGAEELLPLEPAREGARETVVLVDGSGSMAGEPFERARAACVELARALPADEPLSVRVFAAALEPARRIAGGAQEREGALAALWAARAPGGPTALCAALEALAAERERERAPPARLFLLSDGRDTEGCTLERARASGARLAASGARVVALAASADAELERLVALAGPAGVRASDDPLAIGALLLREASAARLACERRARFAAPQGASAASELARRVLAAQAAREGEALALAPGCAPRLALAARGAALWIDQDGAPLAALARHGAGASATLASVPLEGRWPALAARADLLGPVLRALPARELRASLPRAEVRGGALVLEGLPHAPAALALVLRPLAGPFAPEGVRVTALAPAGAPFGSTRSARWPAALADLPGGAPVRIELEPAHSTASLPLEVGAPPAAELWSPRLFAPGAAPSAPARARAVGRHPAAPWLLSAGVCVLALAGWPRRARPSPATDERRAPRPAPRARKEPQARSEEVR